MSVRAAGRIDFLGIAKAAVAPVIVVKKRRRSIFD
jgi:hypothetical protein